MAKNTEVKTIADRHYCLSGDLTFETVAAVSRQLKAHFDGSPDLCIDLSAVDDVDSAGVALLLELVQLSRQSGARLKLEHLPLKMLHLINVNGLSEVIPTAESA